MMPERYYCSNIASVLNTCARLGHLGQLWYVLALILAPGLTQRTLVVKNWRRGLCESVLTTMAHISSKLYASWQTRVERHQGRVSCRMGALCSLLFALAVQDKIKNVAHYYRDKLSSWRSIGCRNSSLNLVRDLLRWW